ncbi:hypothetical protein P0082_05295 [Candidatus Haliotispira prima]|uniref:Uncharacterized protein n=1 Tax=Candidatus Haliotispira prima TaxID=3034016 RepID=A0ABY8MK69_9SPIO|nr:hypothetical protein P0082_05295 [Candidatus Haliotispira prima]
MASSLQLEINSSAKIDSIDAVICLATDTAPTQAEAAASNGYVNFSAPAGTARKISISRHCTGDFSNGLTVADVLTPATDYKLYLYFPDIASNTEFTGLSISNNMAEVSFTTAALPAEGDAQWLNNIGNQCIASLDAYYFMAEQTGTAVCYFYLNFHPPFIDISAKNSGKVTYGNIGTYAANMGAPSASFHFAYGLIPGYTSNTTKHYAYWIGADKTKSIENQIRSSITDHGGDSTLFYIPVTRH